MRLTHIDIIRRSKYLKTKKNALERSHCNLEEKRLLGQALRI